MKLLIIFVASIALSSAELSQQCKDILSTAGISARFNETIGHAIHSMTVEGLQLFDPLATINNHIPTVNQDLSHAQKVLPYAPRANVGSDFTTPTMNMIDKILSTIGDAKDGLGPNWSSIERVVHNFHMWDLWYTIYNSAMGGIQENPPKPETCTCLKDTTANGIKAAVSWVAQHYEKGTPITLLNRPIPKLVDAKAWTIWKNRLLHYYTPGALKDAATYLYCITQKM